MTIKSLISYEISLTIGISSQERMSSNLLRLLLPCFFSSLIFSFTKEKLHKKMECFPFECYKRILKPDTHRGNGNFLSDFRDGISFKSIVGESKSITVEMTAPWMKTTLPTIFLVPLIVLLIFCLVFRSTSSWPFDPGQTRIKHPFLSQSGRSSPRHEPLPPSLFGDLHSFLPIWPSCFYIVLHPS